VIDESGPVDNELDRIQREVFGTQRACLDETTARKLRHLRSSRRAGSGLARGGPLSGNRHVSFWSTRAGDLSSLHARKGGLDMSSLAERRHPAARANGTPEFEPHFEPRVFLQPIAAPSVLGLFGFGGATFVVAANLAGWYGNHTTTPLVLAIFAAAFGGIAQFLAGMWAFKARDTLATAMHGMWGSFWIAYGVLNILVAVGVLAAPTPWYHQPAVAYWFFALAIITASGALAALFESFALFAVLATLAAGSGIAAGSLMYGSEGWTRIAGWVFVFSAGFAWYTATAMMLTSVSGRTILPLGKFKKDANIPGRKPLEPIELEWAEPGVRMGQ
jgi:hypothetical protein